MIYTKGQKVTVPVDVIILKPFAHEDRIYYIARPIKSYADSIWVVTTDGQRLQVTEEILKKAYAALGRI